MRVSISQCSLLAVSIGTALGSVIPQRHVLHEKRELPSDGWHKTHRLHSQETIPLRIGLTQANLDRGHEYLMDTANSKSVNYGKHWSAEQVNEIFAASVETVDTVHQWLTSSGIAAERIMRTAGDLTIGVTVAEAENLLKTEYHGWQHAETGRKQAACDEYHLPDYLQEYIDFVTPGIALLTPRKLSKKDNLALSRRQWSPGNGHGNGGWGGPWGAPKSNPMPPWFPQPGNGTPYPGSGSYNVSADLSRCNEIITPACIKALYHIPPGNKGNPSNSLGIFEDGDFYAQEDLNLFFSNFTPYIPNGTHPTLDSIDGGYAPVNLSDAGGESSLDLQLAYPIIWPQQVTLYQTDDIVYSTTNLTNATGFYNSWLDAIDGSYCTYSAYGITGNSPIDPIYPDPLPGGYKGSLNCGAYKPTNVMSISYSQQEISVPAAYQKRQCNEFMKLALQGHTVVFSSGDTGVAGRPAQPAPNGCLGPDHTIFNPRWPDSCPYVTVVGATKVYPDKTVYDPESVANDLAGHPYKTAYSSSGGFSNIFPIPEFQQQALQTYFEQHDPGYAYYSGDEALGANGGLYNRSGRGYPDVSANGDNIAVYVGGKATREGGTSASTPIFASVITRINEERLAIGKSPVGWVNPILYSHPEVLNDITNGTNPGCGTQGFAAVPGWDPSSGLGTPNYPKMLELFLGLP